MIGIGNEGISLQAHTRTGQQTQVESQNRVQSSSAPAKGDSVSIENLFASFADKVKTMFDSQGGQAGSSQMRVAEFSMQASVKETFEGRYSSSGNGAKVSAYVQQTREVNVSASFKMAQADELAKAQMNAMSQDPFSPEAVASRITDFALGFFPMFAEANPDMTHEEQVDAFQKLVEGAVDEGFKEALAILGNMPNEVTSKLNETIDLVHDKLTSFFDNLRGDGAEAGKAAIKNGTFQDYMSEFFNQEREDKPLTT